MRATIDQAGRLVIPKPLRDALGLGPGEVEVNADGAALRVEAVPTDGVITKKGRLVISGGGTTISDDEVNALRDLDRR